MTAHVPKVRPFGRGVAHSMLGAKQAALSVAEASVSDANSCESAVMAATHAARRLAFERSPHVRNVSPGAWSDVCKDRSADPKWATLHERKAESSASPVHDATSQADIVPKASRVVLGIGSACKQAQGVGGVGGVGGGGAGDRGGAGDDGGADDGGGGGDGGDDHGGEGDATVELLADNGSAGEATFGEPLGCSDRFPNRIPALYPKT